jgi:hypothetical protein
MRLTLCVLALAACCTTTWAASVTVALGGADYLCQTILFPSGCASDPTYLWVNGDFVGENVTGSGLATVNGLGLSLEYNDLLNLGFSETYNVLINGNFVGSFSISGTDDNANHAVTDVYSFAPIVGPSYSVLFEISSATIPFGDGSLGWYNGTSAGLPESSFTLSGTAVPEPDLFPLLALGVAALLRVGKRPLA